MEEVKSKKSTYIISILILIVYICTIINGIFLYKIYNMVTEKNMTISQNVNNKSNVITTVIYDKRCIECNIEGAVSQLRTIPFLQGTKFEMKEFTDNNMSDYIKSLGITKLPAILFNQNGIDKNLDKYLIKLNDSTYSLSVGAKFDPFAKRSAKGFLVANLDEIKSIEKKSFIEGPENADLLWLEYSDLECPFCAKFHNDKTKDNVISKYPGKIKTAFKSFPLDIHKNSLSASLILECSASQKGGKVYYDLINKSFEKYNNNNFDIKGFKRLALAEGLDKSKLEKCIGDNNVSKLTERQEKIMEGQEKGISLFGVSGTPGNVLVNTKTGEYQVFSGDYPEEFFTQTIDKMLK